MSAVGPYFCAVGSAICNGSFGSISKIKKVEDAQVNLVGKQQLVKLSLIRLLSLTWVHKGQIELLLLMIWHDVPVPSKSCRYPDKHISAYNEMDNYVTDVWTMIMIMIWNQKQRNDLTEYRSSCEKQISFAQEKCGNIACCHMRPDNCHRSRKAQDAFMCLECSFPVIHFCSLWQVCQG